MRSIRWMAGEGLVLPVHRPRRLLALHHRLEAVLNHEGRGCHRHVELGAEGLGARPGKGHPPAKASLRQRLQLHLERSKWLNSQSMQHVRGAPYHPMTQGKIERWHQTLKNRILLENYYLPGDLEAQIAAFVADYNHLRYHESIANLTPADVHFGRGQTILIERERIKRQTIANRRLLHRRQAA